jgi:1,6-anhydro-N-acetylmuramate kinase
MTEPTAGQVTSADGTTIAFDRSGAEAAVVLALRAGAGLAGCYPSQAGRRHRLTW